MFWGALTERSCGGHLSDESFFFRELTEGPLFYIGLEAGLRQLHRPEQCRQRSSRPPVGADVQNPQKRLRCPELPFLLERTLIGINKYN